MRSGSRSDRATRLRSFFEHDFVFVADAADRFVFASHGLSRGDPELVQVGQSGCAAGAGRVAGRCAYSPAISRHRPASTSEPPGGLHAHRFSRSSGAPPLWQRLLYPPRRDPKSVRTGPCGTERQGHRRPRSGADRFPAAIAQSSQGRRKAPARKRSRLRSDCSRRHLDRQVRSGRPISPAPRSSRASCHSSRWRWQASRCSAVWCCTTCGVPQ